MDVESTGDSRPAARLGRAALLTGWKSRGVCTISAWETEPSTSVAQAVVGLVTVTLRVGICAVREAGAWLCVLAMSGSLAPGRQCAPHTVGYRCDTAQSNVRGKDPVAERTLPVKRRALIGNVRGNVLHLLQFGELLLEVGRARRHGSRLAARLEHPRTKRAEGRCNWLIPGEKTKVVWSISGRHIGPGEATLRLGLWLLPLASVMCVSAALVVAAEYGLAASTTRVPEKTLTEAVEVVNSPLRWVAITATSADGGTVRMTCLAHTNWLDELYVRIEDLEDIATDVCAAPPHSS